MSMDEVNAIYKQYMNAIRDGDMDTFNKLWDADENIVFTNGDTPLMQACRMNRLKIVAEFLKRDVNVNFVNKKGHCALSTAAMLGHEKLVDVLLMVGDADPNKGNSLLFACAGGNLPIVKMLVEAGANIFAENEAGNTPLSTAEDYKHDDIVDFLKATEKKLDEAVADVDLGDLDGLDLGDLDLGDLDL